MVRCSCRAHLRLSVQHVLQNFSALWNNDVNEMEVRIHQRVEHWRRKFERSSLNPSIALDSHERVSNTNRCIQYWYSSLDNKMRKQMPKEKEKKEKKMKRKRYFGRHFMTKWLCVLVYLATPGHICTLLKLQRESKIHNVL